MVRIVVLALIAGCGRLEFDTEHAYVSAVLADNPLAYWRLDELGGTVAADATGNGNTGTYVGDVTFGVAGAIAGDPDTAVMFDGTTAAMLAGNGFDFTGTQPFSIEAWIAPAVIDDTFRHVFTKELRMTPEQGHALFVHAGDQLGFERYVDDAQVVAHIPVISTTGFSYVVATYDGANLQLYLDGQAVVTVADARDMPSVAQGALIGTALVAGASYFSGVLDDIAVYGTALPASRVLAHFQASQ